MDNIRGLRNWSGRFRRLGGALLAATVTASVSVSLLSVRPAAAAASFGVDKTASVNASGAATISGFSTVQAGELLVAFVSSDGPAGGHQTATVSGGSLSWTLVRRTNAQPGTAEVWQAVATTALSGATFKSVLSTGGYGQSLTIVAFTGASGTGASSGGSGTSPAASVSLTTTAAGSMVFAVGHDWSNATPRTLGSGQTMVHEWSSNATGDDYWVQQLTNSVATPGTVSVNSSVPTSDIWEQTDVEIVPAGPPDTQPPSAPGTLTASGGSGTASLTWGAATDNVAVTGYNIYRSVNSGFTPGPANQITQTSGTSYTDSGLSAGTYYYLVTAFDAAGNVGPPSNQASAAVTAPPPSTGDNTTYLGSNSRTGFNAAETAITAASAPHLAQVWSAASQGNSFVSSQVITSNGVAFWGDQQGYEHATDVTTGKQLWLSPQLGVLQQSQTPSCPGYAPIGINGAATVGQINGRKVVYVADGLANEYALDASTGAIVWETNLGPVSVSQQIFGSAALYNGSLYVGLSSNGDCPTLTQGKLFKLDASTGAVQSTFNVVPNGCVGGGLWGSPTIDAADNAVYITSGNADTSGCSSTEPYAQSIIKLRADTLAYVSSWQQTDPPSTDHDFGSTPTLFDATINGVHRQLVGAVNKNGTFYALDRTNLAAGPVWTYQVSDPGGSPETGNGSIAPASFDGTSLYIGGGSLGSCASELAALNPATGVPRWQDCVDGPIIGGAVTAPGVVVAGVGPYVEVFDSATGKTLFHWTDNNSAWYFTAPTVSSGWILIPKSSGVLYALAPPAISGPVVTAESPAPNAVNVAVSTTIKAQFNEAIDPSTVSVAVTTGSNSTVTGSLTYDATTSTETFTPTAPLTPGTTYQVSVSGATDSASRVMQPFSWTFSTAPPQGACPCFVQQAASHAGGVKSLQVTPSSPLTTGNRLVVEVGVWSGGNATAATVSDSAGDPFTELTHFVASDGTEMSVWSAPITKGGGTTPVVTATPTGTADVGLTVLEYSGLATAADASVVDQTARASGTTGSSAATVSSGVTGATTSAGELAVGFYADSGFGDALKGGSGFTTRTNVSNTGDMELLVQDQIVGLGATVASTSTTGSATTWLEAVVVFKHA
jgi:outer membrane protein assembly factor BamB